jgi:PIN domain nuclease of toxin-antitoxin system
MLESPKTEIYFSAASAWELAIKAETGRLKLPGPIESYLSTSLAEDGFVELPVQLRHALMTAGLPRLHRDPFDRLLVAQARAEALTLLTGDPGVLAYGTPARDARV